MLRDHQDAYGHEIMDYYLGKRDIYEVVEREDGYIDVSSGPSFYFQENENWHEIEKEAMKWVHGRVLDVGCGAGRIALHLQNAGHAVLGIDISPKAIEVCQMRGVKETEHISITQVSSRLGEFDTIMMMGNNFGLFANPRRARWLLKRFRGMTSPEAKIIANSLDVYATDNPDHLAYQQWNRERGRMAGQIRIRIRYRKMKTPWFDYLMVSQDEMTQLLKDSGWQVARFIDSDSASYTAILEKTGR